MFFENRVYILSGEQTIFDILMVLVSVENILDDKIWRYGWKGHERSTSDRN